MKIPSPQDVAKAASEGAFGQPLVTNVYRSQLVEAIMSMALDDGWEWCASDYNAWDFQHVEGAKLEVKQSAARQTWQAGARGYSPPRFDIRQRKARWEGATRILETGRYADLYVFAWHPVTDDTADHRDASQWRFFVVPTISLPATSSIGLPALERLGGAVSFSELGARVTSTI